MSIKLCFLLNYKALACKGLLESFTIKIFLETIKAGLSSLLVKASTDFSWRDGVYFKDKWRNRQQDSSQGGRLSLMTWVPRLAHRLERAPSCALCHTHMPIIGNLHVTSNCSCGQFAWMADLCSALPDCWASCCDPTHHSTGSGSASPASALYWQQSALPLPLPQLPGLPFIPEGLWGLLSLPEVPTPVLDYITDVWHSAVILFPGVTKKNLVVNQIHLGNGLHYPQRIVIVRHYLSLCRQWFSREYFLSLDLFSDYNIGRWWCFAVEIEDTECRRWWVL